MGSVMLMVSLSASGLFLVLLPTRLDDSGDSSFQGQLPETDAAELELPVETPRPAAAAAPVAEAHQELQLLELLRHLRGGRQCKLSFSAPAAARHAAFLKGIPRDASRACASSSVLAVVTIVMFIPLTLVTLA